MIRQRAFEVTRYGTLTLAFLPFLVGVSASACGAADQLPSDSEVIGSLPPSPTGTTTSKPTPTGTTTSKPSPTGTTTSKPTPTGTTTSKPVPTSTSTTPVPTSTSTTPVPTGTPTSPPPPPPKKPCDYKGKSIPHGTSFPDEDGCNTCSCDNGNLGCTQRACPDPQESACILDGQVYESGSDRVPDPESCNTCSCDNGKITTCTEINCPLPKPCRLGRAIYRHDSGFVTSDGTQQCRCNEGELVCKTIP